MRELIVMLLALLDLIILKQFVHLGMVVKITHLANVIHNFNLTQSSLNALP